MITDLTIITIKNLKFGTKFQLNSKISFNTALKVFNDNDIDSFIKKSKLQKQIIFESIFGNKMSSFK